MLAIIRKNATVYVQNVGLRHFYAIHTCRAYVILPYVDRWSTLASVHDEYKVHKIIHNKVNQSKKVPTSTWP